MHAPENPILVGVDTGGTFTDVVVLQGGRLRQCKVLSTPQDPSEAIVEGLRRLGVADRAPHIVHGTTVGTNAVLEGKGARVAYVTSAGFADVLTLGRQQREVVYRLEQPEQPPPVAATHCLEVSTRPLADGTLAARADDAELGALAGRLRALDVEAVAVNLLFAFLAPEEERRIAAALGEDWFVSCASEVLPEIREYERGIATWLNASVGPVIQRYLARLAAQLPGAGIAVMQGSGTTVAAAHAHRQAVRLLLSGPAGGVAAARLLGAATGERRLLTLDMGGTSTDVALLDGGIPLTSESRIAGWPLNVPSVDIHTIGAGGGSIARVDAGGMLLVGPESAGAEPGPACYGRGGVVMTVTDANVVLGRIPGDTLLGGYLPLDAAAAKVAADALARGLGGSRMEAALGVVRLANEHMARALRVISVERGHDPRDHTLLCFGGAGGLHACELAELLGMRRVLMPALGGVLSAFGMLASEPGRELSAPVLRVTGELPGEALEARFAALERQGRAELEAEGVPAARQRLRRQVELRYLGQSATLTLPFTPGMDLDAAFHAAHETSAGHRLARAVELVNLRCSVRGPAPLDRLEPVTAKPAVATARQVFMSELRTMVPLLERRSLEAGRWLDGPAVLTDPAATTWLPPGWRARADGFGNLQLEPRAG